MSEEGFKTADRNTRNLSSTNLVETKGAKKNKGENKTSPNRSEADYAVSPRFGPKLLRNQ